MAFPNRALIEAPAARDLFTESWRPVVRIPGATNGTVQLWDTLDEDYFVALADAQLTIYPNLQAIPVTRKKFVVQFMVYTAVAALGQGVLKRWADCTALDFIKTNNGVKAVTALVTGDVPQEIELMHHWSGNVQETLGTVSA